MSHECAPFLISFLWHQLLFVVVVAITALIFRKTCGGTPTANIVIASIIVAGLGGSFDLFGWFDLLTVIFG